MPGWGNSIWPWVLTLFLVAGLFYIFSENAVQPGTEVPTWADFRTIIREDGVLSGSVVVRNETVRAVLKPDFQYGELKQQEGEKLPVYVQIDQANRQFYLEQLDELDVAWQDETREGQWGVLLAMWAPFLLLLLVMGFLAVRARNAAAGPAGVLGRFSKSKHKVASKEEVNVTLDDVAGVEEAKQEVQELIQFLRQPHRFQSLGARVPRGVLMSGPPGSGKTLLARAIAGEANVPFFSITGSDFVEMFVGVGASRVRDLFQEAKQRAPGIVFLDEIDAIGRKRGPNIGAGGGHDEREQTLNAILSEMDGFQPHDQVVVIAATNRPDVLDPALTRRGRFDRHVIVPLPDIQGRKRILQIHAGKIQLSEDVDFEHLAKITPMFSGADLAAMANEAAIIAGMKGKEQVDMGDMQQARDKIRFGRARKSRRLEEEQRVANAYHEAGHALVQSLLEHADPIEKVTIIPRGQAMGATFTLPERERYGLGKRYLEAMMRVACGGRIAEAEKTGDISTGAANDIDQVTNMAKKMVLEWGMAEPLGFVKYADEESQNQLVVQREWSEQTAAEADDVVRRMVGAAFGDAAEIIRENWDKVTAIAEALLDHETLSAEEVQQLVGGEAIDKPPVNQADAAVEEKRSQAERKGDAALR